MGLHVFTEERGRGRKREEERSFIVCFPRKRSALTWPVKFWYFFRSILGWECSEPADRGRNNCLISSLFLSIFHLPLFSFFSQLSYKIYKTKHYSFSSFSLPNLLSLFSLHPFFSLHSLSKKTNMPYVSIRECLTYTLCIVLEASGWSESAQLLRKESTLTALCNLQIFITDLPKGI